MAITRRVLLKTVASTAVGSLALGGAPIVQAAKVDPAPSARTYSGGDFSDGWQIVLGDSVYEAPGTTAPTIADISTLHYGSYSELRANVQQRRIMAHNITYKSIWDTSAFDCVHTCGYRFRLPYTPSMSNPVENGQTLEGAIFIWDGSGGRLDHGFGFQWILNPWMSSFGVIQCWTDRAGGQWAAVGYLPVDTAWHDLRMVLDPRLKTTSLIIDGKNYPSQYTRTPRPANWGPETAARFQAEAVSLHPGDQGNGAVHRAQFRDWFWAWEPAGQCRSFIPQLISR